MVLTLELDEATATELLALHKLRQARREECGLPDVTVNEVAMTLLSVAIIDELTKTGLPFADQTPPGETQTFRAAA